jgi:hypothetical protein
MGLFSKKSTYDPMSAYTPEQRKSIEALMSLAATGTGGGITLGEEYGGSLGEFNLTDQTKSGLSALQSLLMSSSDKNSDIGKARTGYENMLGLQAFNPDDPRWGYAAFNKALAKSGAESASALEREAAIQGNRYGTAIGGQKADLAENLNLQRQQALANIWQNSQQIAALGAAGLTGLADQVAQLSGMNITYGDMERQMKDTQALRQYEEFNRGRQEELMRLGLMQDQFNNPMGTVTTKSPSTFMRMMGEILPEIGSYNTAKYGYTTNQTSMNQAFNTGVSLLTGGSLTGVSQAGKGSTGTGSSGINFSSGTLGRQTSAFNNGTSSALSSNVRTSYPTGNISYKGTL